MKRSVAVLSTSRADYSHLYWVLHDLREDPDIELKLIVSGAHLSSQFGHTVDEFERDGFRVDARVECLHHADDDVGMAQTIGRATIGLTDVLGQMRPDLLLLIADRYEMLAPASVALALRIPIAHIEGGEVSEGAIDDAVRNALTKLSHIHFTATANAQRRVLAMGEEPWRVHRVGAPSLDHLRRSELPDNVEFEKSIGCTVSPDSVIVSYHPVTIARDTLREADEVFAALDQINQPIFFCFPNADVGGRELIRRAEEFCSAGQNRKLFVNLHPLLYWSLLKNAGVMVGNSSSGIMETPSLALPAVNIGFRQQGRERAKNILDVPAEQHLIIERIRQALGPEFLESLAGMKNPYGDGHAAERIAAVLAEVPLGEQLLHKRRYRFSSTSINMSSDTGELRIPLSAPDITEAEMRAVVEALRGSRLSLGPKLTEFERKVADYAGTQHAVGVSSGTAALHLCVRALGIEPGDEVITTPFSFIASANAILFERARPVFVDVEPDSLNIDPDRIEATITSRTKAILAVHIFGQPASMSAILDIAERHGLKVIEDACQSIGALQSGRRVGSLGDAGVYAFYPNKQMTTGEGGMIVTNRDDVAEAARRLRNHGRAGNDWFEHETLGYNYRLAEIPSALGDEQMARLDAMIARRAEVARSYSRRLADHPDLILLPEAAEDCTTSWFVYVVRLAERFTREDRDHISTELHKRGIGCGRYFAPIHLQPYYRREFGYAPGDFPIAEAQADRALAIPFFNRITEDQIDEVSKALCDLIMLHN